MRRATARFDDLDELIAVGEQLGAEAGAVLIGDPRGRHPAKERKDMLAEPPEIVLVGVVGQRRVADLSDTPTLQPPGRVQVEQHSGGVVADRRQGRGLVASENLLDRHACG
ncbi:MAG TPA: hypothetical protein VN892_05765 [Solirubrobacteraceae bacterium]|nr:hypothetical protein [Solirubrobacteraceae bacterium]